MIVDFGFRNGRCKHKNRDLVFSSAFRIPKSPSIVLSLVIIYLSLLSDLACRFGGGDGGRTVGRKLHSIAVGGEAHGLPRCNLTA